MTPDVATRIAEALERIAAQLEAREHEDEPDLFPLGPILPPRGRDEREQGR